jgi:hypothetical protein
MFSAASGESLKDIKDRLNIRKRGPNSRTVNKDKKFIQTVGGTATTSVKPSTVGSSVASSAAESARQLASAVRGRIMLSRSFGIESLTSVLSHTQLQRCSGCKKEVTSDFATCTACKRRTHLQCAHPALDKAPSGSWFCDGCITEQADRILDFLNQTRRVLANRSTTVVVDVDDEPQAATDAESATEPEADAESVSVEAGKTTNEEGIDHDEDAPMDTEGDSKPDGDTTKETAKTTDGESSDLPSLSELSNPMKSLLDETTLAPVNVPSSKLPVRFCRCPISVGLCETHLCFLRS